MVGYVRSVSCGYLRHKLFNSGSFGNLCTVLAKPKVFGAI